MSMSAKPSVDSAAKRGKSSSSKNGSVQNANVSNRVVVDASPRPGGYLKVLNPQDAMNALTVMVPPELSEHTCCCKTKQKHSKTCVDESRRLVKKDGSKDTKDTPVNTSSHSTTRDFRITKAIEESDWDVSSIEGDIGGAESTAEVTFKETKASLNMTSMLISTVMMLASDNPVPDEYIDATVAFLECVTDDDANTPPNAQSLLNHIELKTGKLAKKKDCTECGYTVLTSEKAKSTNVAE
ncbi:PREDICTED: uncharacterized protein LOC108563303 [Nicrophorus vespilloides]|uniref:Uncharacterized protein LOC108563303 n=1 Tax=Nicrophorus vespilloides TaxID=110193 RepID=A0ABM1MS76_NICVS|nr:PREDICTED: uncharacterized protein LOC108563303 [Nicrophorus vespilloides]